MVATAGPFAFLPAALGGALGWWAFKGQARGLLSVLAIVLGAVGVFLGGAWLLLIGFAQLYPDGPSYTLAQLATLIAAPIVVGAGLLWFGFRPGKEKADE